MKLFLIIFCSFLLTIDSTAQGSKPIYFIDFSNVYQSGLVDQGSNLIMLKCKKQVSSFNIEQYFFGLVKQKLASYIEVLDTLAKTFEIYSVRFSNDTSGMKAANILVQRSSFGRGYLINMDYNRNTGPLTALLIKVFGPEVKKVNSKQKLPIL